MNPKSPIDIIAHSIPMYPKSSFFLNNKLQYVRLFQIQVKLEYRPQDV